MYDIQYIWCLKCRNHREDKFLRATNNKHFENGASASNAQKKVTKSRKFVKVLSLAIAVTASAAALIVPTTTLAPGVDAYTDSRIASYSVGDIDKFSAVITNNCVEETTVPVTEPVKAAKDTKAAAANTEKAKTNEKSKTEKTASSVKKTSATEETKPKAAAESTQSSDTVSESNDYDNDYSSNSESYSGGALVTGAVVDPSYTPTHVSLSDYDRAKTERLVMGEGGIMGYEGCALIAQSIRDAMVRSGTSSIDRIISEYQYFGSTDYEPNQDVKDAVSFIFDQDGVAIQHRVLCFYIGSSEWHETQTYLYQIGGVRFFDLVSA